MRRGGGGGRGEDSRGSVLSGLYACTLWRISPEITKLISLNLFHLAAGGFDHCGMNGVSTRERVESDVDEAMVMEVDSPLLLPGEEDEGRGGGASVDLENPMDIEKVLSFGRDLQALFNQVTASKPNDKLKIMLQVREVEGERESMLLLSLPLVSGLLQLAGLH